MSASNPPGKRDECQSDRWVDRAYRLAAAQRRSSPSGRSDEEFLAILGHQLDARRARARRRRSALLAAAALILGTGLVLWVQQLAQPDPRKGHPADLMPISEAVDPMRLAGVRGLVRAVLGRAGAPGDEAFLEQVERGTEELRAARWPIDVLILRQLEISCRHLDGEESHQLIALRALRWVGLARPPGAERILERALRRPPLAAAACRALASYGSARAMRRLAQLAAHPEDFPFAPDELARSGLAGLHRLLELWDGEGTPKPIRTALERDPAALDRALAERITRARLQPSQLGLLERFAGPACQGAFERRFTAERLEGPGLEIAVSLGGELALDAVLAAGFAHIESHRAPYIDAAARILARARDRAPALALGVLEKDSSSLAALLLQAVSRLDPTVAATTFLALLDSGQLEEELGAAALLRVAALPPGETPTLAEQLRRRMDLGELPSLLAAAYLSALASRQGAQEALAALSWKRLTPARRARLVRRIGDALREDPGVAGLAALRRLEPLIAAYRS